MQNKPLCSRRLVVAQSKLFTVEQMDLTFSNGAFRQYERVCSRGYGSVMIVALTDVQSLLLIREYAAGTNTYELAFPKGLIDQGESAIEAANRELQEETGVAAKELTWLRSMTLAPGYFNARMDLVVASNLYPSALPGDEPEEIEVLEWPLSALDELLERPDFTESRSIAALFLVKDWLNKKENKDG